ncbi:heme biosynthesis HemY N-terminal domain-containing protein [Thiofilum flexile]|uniref:heme biosynthesis HemY N-terminal domain-containing protein n=1 Tax=Thiofilum flexile TaxID=125627 RepID=UPI00036834A4|nr:heme biosynthesis HemY N-terminal domain-containing protein [Thiofilum flexile]
MRYLIGLGLVLIIFLGLLYWSINNPGMTLVSWNENPTYIMQGRTAAFILYLVLGFFTLHFALNAFYRLLHLRQIIKDRYAARTFARGLLKLTEGNWNRAEKLLLYQADETEMPVLSYIAAARAAHMQEAYDRRDEWLRRALLHNQGSRLAVGVSQADMQITANQLEQAHATLRSLQPLAPKHPYVLRLLARVLYQQENWDELVDLLPELITQKILKAEDMQKIEVAALTGLFEQQLKQGGIIKLKAMWQRLPTAVTTQPEAVYIYTKILLKIEDYETSAQMIETTLNQTWHDGLAELYGRTPQRDIEQALANAKQWQTHQANNPVLLLMLARLYRQQQNWLLAKHYYESSVNQAPNAEAYLELAELLEYLGETENAQHSYQVGLRYSIYRKGERLILKPISNT